jgi:hypothetical protein
MRYLRSYVFMLNGLNGVRNVLMSSICLLIPGLGLWIFLGYAGEVLQALHDPESEGQGAFAWRRLGRYLERGWPPFLLVMSASVVGLLVGGLLGLLAWKEAELARQGGVHPAVLAGVVAGVTLVYLVGLLGLMLVLALLTFWATCGQPWELGPLGPFVRDFCQRGGWELLLVEVLILATTPLVLVAGSMLCGVGVLPALALIGLAQHQLLFQLYELYLSRGGSGLAPRSWSKWS